MMTFNILEVNLAESARWTRLLNCLGTVLILHFSLPL
jgi:hypothetical protein